jgi:hypothetical protein
LQVFSPEPLEPAVLAAIERAVCQLVQIGYKRVSVEAVRAIDDSDPVPSNDTILLALLELTVGMRALLQVTYELQCPDGHADVSFIGRLPDGVLGHCRECESCSLPYTPELGDLTVHFTPTAYAFATIELADQAGEKKKPVTRLIKPSRFRRSHHGGPCRVH